MRWHNRNRALRGLDLLHPLGRARVSSAVRAFGARAARFCIELMAVMIDQVRVRFAVPIKIGR